MGTIIGILVGIFILYFLYVLCVLLYQYPILTLIFGCKNYNNMQTL